MRLPEKGPSLKDILHDKAADQINSHFDLIQNEKMRVLLEQAQREYLPWEKVKYLKTHAEFTPQHLWQSIKILRASGQQLVFNQHQFRYSITPYMQKALHEFDMQYGGQFGIKEPIRKEDQSQYLISSIMEEAIASSQIEGAVTTRMAAKEMLRKKLSPRSKSERMILNNYNTIQLIREIIQQPLTPEKLLEVQRSMTINTLQDSVDEGRFRDNDEVNVVDSVDGEVMYTPPSHKELPELIKLFCEFFNEEKEDQFIHPVVKAAIIHFLIGFIHPFVDGNGRTARALFYWYLLKRGYWLTEYLSISGIILKTRIQYAKAYLYTETDENDLSYFINYKLKILKLAYSSLQAYINRKLNERKSASTYLKSIYFNSRQAIIIQEFTADPDRIFTVQEVEYQFGVSNQTARNDLTSLESMGLLRQIHLNKRKAAFERRSDFDNKLAELLKEENKN